MGIVEDGRRKINVCSQSLKSGDEEED